MRDWYEVLEVRPSRREAEVIAGANLVRFLPSARPAPHLIHPVDMRIAYSALARRKNFPSRPTSTRRVIQLDRDLVRCRHGHALQETATEEISGGWIVWGKYPCSSCARVGLDHVPSPPDVIFVGGRRLVPHRLSSK